MIPDKNMDLHKGMKSTRNKNMGKYKISPYYLHAFKIGLFKQK